MEVNNFELIERAYMYTFVPYTMYTPSREERDTAIKSRKKGEMRDMHEASTSYRDLALILYVRARISSVW